MLLALSQPTKEVIAMKRLPPRSKPRFSMRPWNRSKKPDQPTTPKITPTPIQPPRLPAIGESIDLGPYGTCTVLSITPGPYGVQMFEFRCDRAGHKTTPGDVFKMSDREAIRRLTDTAQHAIDLKYYQFCGIVKKDIAHLGPAAWKSFLDWIRTVDVVSLPPNTNNVEAQGRLGEFYQLHERTIAGFTTQWSPDDRPTFSVVDRQGNTTITDTIQETEIRALAQEICDRSTGDTPWAQYRRLVAEEVEFLVGATRRIIAFVIAHQKNWIRTGDITDLKRLAFSHEALCANAQCAAATVRSLLSNIGSVTSGNREIDVQEFFTGTDFEYIQITTAIARAVEVTGCASLERMTIAARNTLRRAAIDALNKDMPPYLQRPLSDERFHNCLTAAMGHVKLPKKDRVDAARAWTEEGGQLLAVIRDHRWNITTAATTLRITPRFLREHLDRHELLEQYHDGRDTFILKTYRDAAPSAFETRTIVYRGIKAVADALAIDISDVENLGPMGHAERAIKNAFLRVDARRKFAERTVRAVINCHHGDRTKTARALGIRIAHLHKLLDVYELWGLAWIRGTHGLIRGDIWRRNQLGIRSTSETDV